MYDKCISIMFMTSLIYFLDTPNIHHFLLYEIFVLKKGNLALNKPARQSTTSNPQGEASHATDGNTAQNYFSKSCTHTALEQDPWIYVDLKQSTQVGSMKIFNRGDCCGECPNGNFFKLSLLD